MYPGPKKSEFLRTVTVQAPVLALCLVTQAYPALWDPMDCSPPDSLSMEFSRLEWVAMALLQGIFPTQGSNPGLLHCRQIISNLSHK